MGTRWLRSAAPRDDYPSWDEVEADAVRLTNYAYDTPWGAWAHSEDLGWY